MKRFFHAVPLFLVIAVQLGAWSMLLSGGMVGVRGWILLLTLVPFVGALTLLGTLVRLAWKRQFRRTTAALLAFSLLALWPGAWSFGALQIRYPASLDEMKPAATVRPPGGCAPCGGLGWRRAGHELPRVHARPALGL